MSHALATMYGPLGGHGRPGIFRPPCGPFGDEGRLANGTAVCRTAGDDLCRDRTVVAAVQRTV